MAEVKFSKNDLEWTTLNEFWSILQKYYVPEDTEEYWEKVVSDVNVFGGKEPKLLRRELAKTLINVLEQKYRESKATV